jgi:hypothetical protein
VSQGQQKREVFCGVNSIILKKPLMGILLIASLIIYWVCIPSWSDKKQKKKLQQEEEDKLPRIRRLNGKKVL